MNVDSKLRATADGHAGVAAGQLYPFGPDILVSRLGQSATAMTISIA